MATALSAFFQPRLRAHARLRHSLSRAGLSVLRDRLAQASVGSVERGHRARSDRAALGVCSPVAKGPRGRMYTAVQGWTPEGARKYKNPSLCCRRDAAFVARGYGRRLWIGFGELSEGSCLTPAKMQSQCVRIDSLLAILKNLTQHFRLIRGPPRRQAKPDPQGSCVTITDFVKIF